MINELLIPSVVMPSVHRASFGYNNMCQRNVEIDVLRGCAIVLVLINHMSVAFVSPPTWLDHLPIDGCSIGVALFFAVSGYVITITLKPVSGTAFFWRSFYVRRFFRIFPLSMIWVQITLVGTLLFNFHGFFGEWETNSRAASWILIMAANIGMNIDKGGLGALGVYWSLSVEEQFYIIIPILMLLGQRAVATITLLVLLNVVLLANGPVAKDFYQFTPLLMGLLVGLILPREASIQMAARLAPVRYVLWFLLCMLPFGAEAALTSYRSYCGVYVICAIIVTAAALRQTWLLRPAPLSRLLRYIGTRSYGLYLSHFAISMFLREFWKSVLDRGVIHDDTMTQVVMLVSWLAVTFVVTELLHRWIEVPMIDYGRHASDALGAEHLVARRAVSRRDDLRPVEKILAR